MKNLALLDGYHHTHSAEDSACDINCTNFDVCWVKIPKKSCCLAKTLYSYDVRYLITFQMDAVKNRVQHIGLIVWLLIYVPFAQAIFGQAVLCFGTDGHVALENISSDGACHDESHIADMVDQGCLTVDHCGPCLDLLPHIDELNFSHQDNSLCLDHSLAVVVFHSFPSVFRRLQNPPVSVQKNIHPSIPTTVLQI